MVSLATAVKTIAGSQSLESAGQSISSKDGAEGWISLQEHFRLMQDMTESAHDESLGMSQRSLVPGTTDFVIDILFQADDLEDAMKRAARTYNLIHGGYFNEVTRRRGCLVYTIDDRDFPYAFPSDSPAAYSVMEGLLIFLHAMLTLITGAQLSQHVRCVRSRRPARGMYDGFLSFWESPVRCGAKAYALEYDLTAAASTIRKPRDQIVKASAVYDTVSNMIAERERRVAKNDLSLRVVELVHKGITEQSMVAQELGVSVATLRRRLSEAKTSFRMLRNETLNESAKIMLRQGRPVIVVAESLKYVDVRSFSRAFKSWNGMTPAAFVSQLNENDKP